MPKMPLFDSTGIILPELLAPNSVPSRSMTSDDLELGKAAEHLVCADLIIQGYRAFLTDQGLPYDILVDIDGNYVRVQVKATRKPKNPQPSSRSTPGYFFNVKRAGKGGRRRYPEKAFDLLALVAMDRQLIAYLPPEDCRRQMVAFRVPDCSYRKGGKYREFHGSSFERALGRYIMSVES